MEAQHVENLCGAERMIEVFNVNCIGPVTTVQELVKAKLIGPPGSIVGTLTSKASLLPALQANTRAHENPMKLVRPLPQDCMRHQMDFCQLLPGKNNS